eukprot:CAMPEP_0183484634 /NCGR_PEP_ID=MMETSP0370-20130417/179021_1 /TAXON_ID=268820 /ORGANISM="Peridinium aciculiferum, Strain PAER-2" /LENGTH=412 /DNA_ID=CAMNT_0025677925 /DNA_START=142 /DNA_END=1380 /DNA_ORIENTATION=-
MALMAIGGLATAAGVLPYITDLSWRYPVGFMCRVLGMPTFVALLLFARELQGLLGSPGPTVFLDKTCIHQDDQVVQRQGIEKLSAFLSNSEIMVALYTDTYLLKLWTVYEVASFLALRPIKCMKIVPVYQLFAYHNGLLVGYLAQMSTIVLRSYTTFAWHELILWNGVFGLLVMVACQRWAREKESIQTRLANFSVHNCICTCESDRPLVCQNIAILMRASGAAPDDASDETALEHFDQLARHELPSAFTTCMSRVSLSYKQVVVFCLFWQGTTFLDVDLASLELGRPLKEVLMAGVGWCFWTTVCLPLAFVGMEYLAASFLRWTGFPGLVWLTCSFILLVSIPCFVVNKFIWVTSEMAVTSNLALVVLLVSFGIGGAGVYLAFSGQCSLTCPCRRSMGPPSIGEGGSDHSR